MKIKSLIKTQNCKSRYIYTRYSWSWSSEGSFMLHLHVLWYVTSTLRVSSEGLWLLFLLASVCIGTVTKPVETGIRTTVRILYQLCRGGSAVGKNGHLACERLVVRIQAATVVWNEFNPISTLLICFQRYGLMSWIGNIYFSSLIGWKDGFFFIQQF